MNRKRQQPSQKDEQDAIVRRLVMRIGGEYSISLRMGRYLTQEQIDAIVDRARSHDFSKFL